MWICAIIKFINHDLVVGNVQNESVIISIEWNSI